MAFPVVESTATSAETSGVTTHTPDMPSGIVSGDTLVVVAGLNERQVGSAVSGWTLVDQDFHDAGASVQLATLLLTRTADGTEGATEDVFTTGGSCKSASIVFRISGTSGTVENAPDASSVSAGINPDPPSLSPSGGAADYLWLAVGLMVPGDATWSSAPASYSSLLSSTTGSGTSQASIAVARRTLNASTENPGTFSISDPRDWMAWTIAVFPESATPVSQTIAVPTQHSAEITKTTSTPTAHFQAGEAPHTVEASHFQTVGSPKTVRTHHFQEIAQILQIPTYHRAAAPISNPPPMGGRRGPGRWAGVIARRGRRK